VALEKDGDKSGAIQEFRGFLVLFKDKAAKGAPSKEETRLEGVCRKRLSELAFGEAEFQRLEQALVDELMKFAREWFLRDPASATKALQVLLQVRADHAEAAALLKKLGGAGTGAASGKEEAAAAAVPEPFRKVKSWQDLLATKVFVIEQTEEWKYEGPNLVGDLKGGSIFNSRGFSDTGPDYAIEMEVKVLAEHERGWLAGPVFGNRKGAFLSAFFQKTMVTLLDQKGMEKNVLAEVDMPPVETNAWHRLGVIVRGNAIQVWFDGKVMIDLQHPSRSDFSGQVGIFQQRNKAEYRLIRIGALD
jgi:hypothetical protein